MRSIFYAALIASLLPVGASAACDLAAFNKSLPPPISALVSRPGFEFEWASDLDHNGTIGWVWNYVYNRHTSRSLNVTWEKANIQVPFANPLPPGAYLCNIYPISDISPNDIDDDAPIIYGASNNTQKAALYAKKISKSALSDEYSSEISTTYTSDSGETKSLRVNIFYVVSDGVIKEMTINAPDDVYVAIGDIDKFWSKETYVSFVEAAEQQKVFHTVSSDAEFADNSEWSTEFFATLSRPNSGSLISKGTLVNFASGAEVVSSGQAMITVYNEDRRPLISGLATIPVTKK